MGDGCKVNMFVRCILKTYELHSLLRNNTFTVKDFLICAIVDFILQYVSPKIVGYACERLQTYDPLACEYSNHRRDDLYHDYMTNKSRYKLDPSIVPGFYKQRYSAMRYIKSVTSVMSPTNVASKYFGTFSVGKLMKRTGYMNVYDSVIMQDIIKALRDIVYACINESRDHISLKITSTLSPSLWHNLIAFYKMNKIEGPLIFEPWILPALEEKPYEPPVLPAELKHLTFKTESAGNTYTIDVNSNIDTPNIFGSVVRICGHNGSGKSSLAKVIYDPISSWLVNGCSIPLRKTLVNRLSIPSDDMDVLYVDQHGSSSLNSVAAYEFMLSEKLAGTRTPSIHYLSQGQKAKLFCKDLLDLANSGTTLVFDEPTAPMDSEGKDQFWKHLDSIRKDHVTYVISHEIPEWFKCDYEIHVNIELEDEEEQPCEDAKLNRLEGMIKFVKNVTSPQ